MKNICTPRGVTGFIAALFFLSASSAIADVNIGGNVIWHDAADGATIEVLGPHPDLDIQAIINGITDASGDKPYLIKLGAGVYDLGEGQIRMRDSVSIQGVGRNSTHINSAVKGDSDDKSSALIVVEGINTALTDLSISNNGGLMYSYGIYSGATDGATESFRIERVYIEARGGSEKVIGVFNNKETLSSVFKIMQSMNDVEISVSGDKVSHGIWNNEMRTSMSNVTVTSASQDQSGSGITFKNTIFAGPMNNLFVYTTNHGVAINFEGVSTVHIINSWVAGNEVAGNSDGALSIKQDAAGSTIVNTRISGKIFDEAPPKSKNCFGTYGNDLSEIRC